MTTTRKFFTVLISIIFLRNPITVRQGVATALVFIALFADALWGKKELCKSKGEAVPTEEPDLEKNNSPTKTSVEMETLNKEKFKD